MSKTRIYTVGYKDLPMLVEAKSAAAALKIACDDMGMDVNVATAKDVANLMKEGATVLRSKDEPQQTIRGA